MSDARFATVEPEQLN